MNPMRTAFAALVSTLAAASAIAAPTTFIPNPDHTFVRFSYDHMGFTTQESRFNKTTGTVTLDPGAKTGSVDGIGKKGPRLRNSCAGHGMH